jgi:hypothetical protein
MVSPSSVSCLVTLYDGVKHAVHDNQLLPLLLGLDHLSELRKEVVLE